jgi:hypothetical protein
MTKTQALTELLKPIKWRAGSSIGARQNIVMSRHLEVEIVYPFLTRKEKKLADEWLEREEHYSLWD